MPCLSNQYNPGIGLLINIGVLSPGILTPATVGSTPITAFPALIDTGASITCISSKVAQTVGLKPVGMRPVASATQAVPVNMYLVDLVITFGATGYLVASTQVLEFAPPDGSPYQMLVGRDIICRGALAMSFDGHFTFSL
jgi:predicted aspartyl protease